MDGDAQRPTRSVTDPPRAALSRDRIITTAIDFVDKRGLTALTMRRLGKELGVEAMSLYRYVNGREDLLEGIVDRMVTDLHLRSDNALLTASDGWQAYLQWLAHSVRSLARDHPKVFPLIATRHPAAPWLRPPLRSLRVVEDFLGTLISRGFDDDRAVEAYRAFSSFLLGYLLFEATLLGAQTGPAEEPSTRANPTSPTPTRTSTSTTFRTSTGSRRGSPKTTPPPSSNRPSKTFWTGSTGSSPNDRTTAVLQPLPSSPIWRSTSSTAPPLTPHPRGVRCSTSSHRMGHTSKCCQTGLQGKPFMVGEWPRRTSARRSDGAPTEGTPRSDDRHPRPNADTSPGLSVGQRGSTQ